MVERGKGYAKGAANKMLREFLVPSTKDGPPDAGRVLMQVTKEANATYRKFYFKGN